MGMGALVRCQATVATPAARRTARPRRTVASVVRTAACRRTAAWGWAVSAWACRPSAVSPAVSPAVSAWARRRTGASAWACRPTEASAWACRRCRRWQAPTRRKRSALSSLLRLRLLRPRTPRRRRTPPRRATRPRCPTAPRRRPTPPRCPTAPRRRRTVLRCPTAATAARPTRARRPTRRRRRWARCPHFRRRRCDASRSLGLERFWDHVPGPRNRPSDICELRQAQARWTHVVYFYKDYCHHHLHEAIKSY